jgi:alcohol dehydrogenase
MLPTYYEFIVPTKILAGRKALSNLAYELDQLGVSRPLLITDKGVAAAGLVDKVAAALADGDRGLGPVFDEVPPDSSNRVVNRVAALYRAEGCDGIIALGGGSAIDTAKGVNILISEEAEDLLDFQGVDRLTRPMRPLIAIPTTAGTGTEATNAAVIYNEETGTKMGLISWRLFPHVALVDPAMTATLPPRITAATGMDALTHAVEAYIGLQKNPVSDGFALAAIRLIARFLVRAVKDGKDEEARLGMANAALLAGIAFTNSMVGGVHALAHATGGVCHVPHGVANGIYLPWILEYNGGRIQAELAELADVLAGRGAGSDADRARRTVDAVRRLQAECREHSGLPITLSQAGVEREMLPRIARAALDDGALNYNAEEADESDLLGILEKAY